MLVISCSTIEVIGLSPVDSWRLVCIMTILLSEEHGEMLRSMSLECDCSKDTEVTSL